MSEETLALKHKEPLARLLRTANSSLSEYSFANLYLFRQVHDYRVRSEQGELYVTGKSYDGKRFIMPTRDIRENGWQEIEELLTDYDCIFPIAEDWLQSFQGNGFEAEYSDNDSDYVYFSEKLLTFKGHQLHAKRNLLRQFLAHYSPEVQELDRYRISDAVHILEAWQTETGVDPRTTDYFPCKEAFELCGELGLRAFIYYIAHEPAGFVIGEAAAQQMFILHFAKAKRKFKGIYQYLYNHVAQTFSRDYRYFNLEQDLGKPELKASKASYRPDQMLRKYRVCLKTASQELEKGHA